MEAGMDDDERRKRKDASKALKEAIRIRQSGLKGAEEAAMAILAPVVGDAVIRAAAIRQQAVANVANDA
jgi:hypothetical protein